MKVCVDMDLLEELSRYVEKNVCQLKASANEVIDSCNAASNDLEGNRFDLTREECDTYKRKLYKAAYELQLVDRYLKRMREDISEYLNCEYKGDQI